MSPWKRLALRARRREMVYVRFWKRVDDRLLIDRRATKRWTAMCRDYRRLRKLSIILAYSLGVSPEAWRETYYSEYPRAVAPHVS